ncbi:MAG: flagellar filament capping protein FliD [Hydrogenophaga sp.]|uniref:flagellar filament capping protein FliD n=1 Tax=Hydrogenophaga sp. TaxID=1904254 RepID=UPI00260DE0BA|nr:flagellar filament capping protein FliD [Hydrogenophaga sp.]MDM7942398.1 flagellar filament capping protein FliD [Hydrogenophaga sp.]
MATIAATGTSVLDVVSIVSGLMEVENLALTKIDKRISAVNTKVSALGSFMAKASALQTALDTLGTASSFTARTTTSSNSALVTVAATTSADAATLAVQVKQSALAQQTLVSGFGSAADSVSTEAGAFNLTNTATSAVTAVAVTAGMTLTELAAAINESDAGVSASVVQQTDTGWSLLLTSDSVGADQAFSTGFTPTSTGVAGSLDNTTTSEPQSATDAAIRVNGIDYSRSSNTFSDILSGVTLTLNQPVSAADWDSASSASVSVGTSNSKAASAVNAVVTAYNEAYTLYKSLTRSNADASLRGPLSGDQTLHNFMGQVRAMIDGGFNDGAGNNVRFYNAGITTAADGTLKVDSAELTTALEGTLGTILANGTSVRPATGTQSLLAYVRSSVLTGGLLASGKTSGESMVDSLNDQRDTVSGRLVSKQARYTAQYARLDAMLTGMQQTSTALQGALDSIKAQNEANK